mgnify:FL=1
MFRIYTKKQKLLQVFNTYSYLTDENILKNLLEKTDDKSLEDIKSIDDLPKFFYKLNQKIDTKDVLSHLFTIESNLNIIDMSLDNCDEDYAHDIKTVNQHNLKLLKEILLMLESRDFIELTEI